VKIDVSRIEGVSGAFDTDKDKLICIGNSKYGSVSLCFMGGWHVTFADIKLYSTHRAIDADATFNDAKSFGDEIVNRFNHFNEKCEWKYDNDVGYTTLCGGAFSIVERTPSDNKMKFCPYCGKEIEVKEDA